ncbi:MAG: formylglycine-generating enzyme family protein [Prevotellaceae bacterium]|jgi:formylglycine-generating enzyme required for sulfatase activity|nr:formylglycine-generating enzyme family protein [Prevotellaceae bacterium]
MVPVEGGTFRMGSTNGFPDELPVHEVTLDSFNIGKYPVTQAQWRRIMGGNENEENKENHPVVFVSWDSAREFCDRLNAITGKKYRLPTEAEWEYAARGGKKSKGYRYSGSNDIKEVGWYGENSNFSIHPVGEKEANELGIHDMSGNVWEWCNDWHGPYPDTPQTNPKGPSGGSTRVIRGGSWDFDARSCRVSSRDYDAPGDRIDDVGFRLALP